MTNPYVMERCAQEKHADRVRKSTRIEQAAAARSPTERQPTLMRRLVVAMLTALAALERGKQ